MKDFLTKTLKSKIEDLLKLWSEHKAYSEYINYVNSTPEFKNNFTDEELEFFFPKPPIFEIDMVINTFVLNLQIASKTLKSMNFHLI